MLKVQNTINKWQFIIPLYGTVLIIALSYYSHITYHDLPIGIADENFLFGITSCFCGILLLIITSLFSKESCGEKEREKIANTFGIVSLITSFGALFIFAVIVQRALPVWTCDLLVQITIVTGIAAIIILPKKADHRLMVSVIFALIAAVVYLCYRF